MMRVESIWGRGFVHLQRSLNRSRWRFSVVRVRHALNLLAGLPSKNQGVGGQGKSMRWSAEADEILSRAPVKRQREVARDVEKAAKASRRKEVPYCTARQIGSNTCCSACTHEDCLFPLSSKVIHASWHTDDRSATWEALAPC